MDLKQRMQAGETLVGTFVKTPSYELVEVLAKSKLDFICLDAEHAPFDRARLDQCLALGRALKFPVLVRVSSAAPSEILGALDSGAVGIVVPHVDTAEKARDIAKAARFGHGGRGYAGSTRWAGFATRKMPDVMAQSDETIMIAQIEEPEGVDAIDQIAATPGIDGIFAGPADLAVCYGETDAAAPRVIEALKDVGIASQSHGKTYMTFAGSAADGPRLKALGITMFFVASEHSFMLRSANADADGLKP